MVGFNYCSLTFVHAWVLNFVVCLGGVAVTTTSQLTVVR